MSFAPIIGPNEEIKFIGSYDRGNTNKFFVQVIPGYPGGNVGQVVDIAGVCTNTFLSVNFVTTKDGLLGSSPYIDENYSLVSYPIGDNKLPKIGSLVWSGTYREELTPDGKTISSVQEFPVTGASGIYSEVSKVIIDFNNIVRVVYFIGPKNM